MKNWMWSLLVAMLTLLVIRTFHIPIWLMMITILPLLLIVLVTTSFLYNFRKSIRFQDVPTYGFSPRLKALDKEATRVESLDFSKIDQFYLKTIPDSLTYAFKHHQEPIFYCLYHLGSKASYELVTLYKENFVLTSAATLDSGLAPRPPKALLQIFPKSNYETLFSLHQEAHQFLLDHGLKPLTVNQNEFRTLFLKSYLDHATYIKSLFLWPINLIFRVFSKPGRKYCHKIREQYPEGISKI